VAGRAAPLGAVRRREPLRDEAVLPGAHLARPPRPREARELGSLIAAHALLHQRQRERDRAGRLVATPADYRAVYELVRPLVDAELDGLSPRAVRVYRHLGEAATGAVTRRDVATAFGWSYTAARRALAELVDQELVAVFAAKKPGRYRLFDRSLLRGAPCLTPPEEVGA